jgi:hypothetical protein
MLWAVLIVAVFIAILFYKQANESFQILQLDAERLSELPTLYQDRSPIVVRGTSGDQLPTGLGTEAELRRRPAVLAALAAPATPLSSVLNRPGFNYSPVTTAFLAKESGLDTWFRLRLFDTLLPSPYTRWFYTSKTSLWPSGRGLFKTTAFQTLVMPTQGTVIVTLLLQSMIPYLPTRWEGRRFASLTAEDTPLLTQIKFIEIRIRTGNFVLIPPHVLADIRSEGETAWVFMAEIHHPISAFAT